MENNKKNLTKTENEVNNLPITDALEAFNKLLEIGINQGLSVAEISAKTGINKQALYRYSSCYDSQKKIQPSLLTISKLCVALGYEITANKISELENK
jgi:DNA-binding phage protein